MQVVALVERSRRPFGVGVEVDRRAEDRLVAGRKQLQPAAPAGAASGETVALPDKVILAF